VTSFVPFGDAAMRAPLPAGVAPRDALFALRACPGAVDVVVTETFACVYFDPADPPAGLDGALEAVAGAAFDAPVAHVHVVRVRYDGEDLADVAARARLSPRDVARAHAGREYVVKTVGFLPGFAYLGDVDPRLAVPRRPAPRARVPPNAVALAAGYTGIYPFASPGGWHLIGSAVDFHAFDAQRGATFALGDRVRFVEER
jgi:UPF0271 protein